MFIKTQDGSLVLVDNFKVISICSSRLDSEVKIDDIVIGRYENNECAKMVVEKIEDSIRKKEELIKIPTREDVNRWLEL